MADTFPTPAPMAARTTDDYFFLYMATVCAAVAFMGFAPTYWLPLVSGRLNAHPVIHLHAAVFFAWSVYFVGQSWLAASGRLRSHRKLGLIGVSLATAMTMVGINAAINRMHWAASLGLIDAGKSFAIVPISTILFFASAFIASVANARRRDWHKRLMLVAAISILDAPIARWFVVFLAPPDAPPGPPPVAVDLGPSLIALLILIFAMVVDRRRIGKFHGAYLYGALGYIAMKVLQVPISESSAWHATAAWLMRLGG